MYLTHKGEEIGNACKFNRKEQNKQILPVCHQSSLFLKIAVSGHISFEFLIC